MVDHPEIVYVPVLKWREGEKKALKNLDSRSKLSIIPLIELVNDEGDDPNNLSNDIVSYWGKPAYLDVHYRPDSFALQALNNIVTNNTERGQDVDVIPVVRLDTPPIILEGIKTVAAACNNGMAIRITATEKEDFEFDQRVVEFILSQVRDNKPKIDLIIDFGYLENVATYEVILKQIYKAIPLDGWRRVIISAGVIPPTLTLFKPNEDNYLPRVERQLWLAHKGIFQRNVIYSDYTVRNPDNAVKMPYGSISVRYTTEDNYQIFRGIVSDKHFKYLVHALNIRTLYKSTYKESYCWGDTYIEEKASQFLGCLQSGIDPETYTEFKPGNKTDWVAASVNHHMSVVLKSDMKFRGFGDLPSIYDDI